MFLESGSEGLLVCSCKEPFQTLNWVCDFEDCLSAIQQLQTILGNARIYSIVFINIGLSSLHQIVYIRKHKLPLDHPSQKGGDTLFEES